MSLEKPLNMGFSTSPSDNMEFKYQQHKAMMDSVQVIYDVDKEFGDQFGRYYNGMIDTYYCDDAEVILITVGSVTGTTRVVVDSMRKQGLKVGLLKIRYMRPFPEKEIQNIVKNAKIIGVLDKDISFGFEGTIFTNVNSALVRMQSHPQSYNFVAGMGGRDISKADIEEMFMDLIKASKGEEIERVKFVNMGVEING